MDKIVVGVDGSDGSLHALRWAAAEARVHGARLAAVASWHPSAVSSLPAWGVAEPVSDALDVLHAGLVETLEAEGIGGSAGPQVDPVVVEGHPAAALIDASTDADLLVVGTRGHGGFAGMVLGSVGQHVTSHATCPVVVVPPRP